MKFKKLITVVMSAIMLSTMSITVFAANLSNGEQSIISALKTAKVPAEYVTQAQNYFLLDGVDISDGQAAQINSQIDAARAVAGNASKFSELSASQKNSIVANLAAAGKVIGLTVNFNAAENTLTILKDGKTIFEASAAGILTPVSGSQGDNSSSNNNSDNGIIKPSGNTAMVSIITVALLAVAVMSCGIIIMRKRNLAREDA